MISDVWPVRHFCAFRGGGLFRAKNTGKPRIYWPSGLVWGGPFCG